MEPLNPQDPLYRLLGKAKTVEPRPNFTQNVVRAVRQIGQKPAFWERVESWLAWVRRPVAAGGAAVVLMVLAVALSGAWKKSLNGPATPVATARISHPSASNLDGALSNAPTESDVASELDGMNQLGILLAQRDPSTLSDSEIGALLY